MANKITAVVKQPKIISKLGFTVKTEATTQQ